MGIKFVDNDSENILNELVTQFEAVLGESLQPSDERRIFLYQLAQVVVGLKSDINDTGNQVLLRYARGEALDAIGELLGVYRLPESFAKCNLKFSLSAVQPISITIPKGTRVTPDGYVYFATDSVLTIPAGSLTGEVGATATEAGIAYNDYAADTLIYIVDNTQFLASVTNTDKTAGGTDRESDDSLRERIRLAPESFSTAGSEESYIYWAKTASADVGDVVVTSLKAGEVNIYILKADGTIPDATNDKVLFDSVYKVVSAKDKRPLTDKVNVLPPTKKEYSINLRYYISADDEANATDIANAVNKAVKDYIAWQGEKIGRDINPDKLRSLVLEAGAVSIILTAPSAYTAVSGTEIASFSGDISDMSETVIYMGIRE
jgi:phage-related baseplate assembly protein